MANIHDQQLRTLVVGLGATGLSVARYLMAQGVQVAIADSREQPPGMTELQAEYPDLALFLVSTRSPMRSISAVVLPGSISAFISFRAC